ncbi:MAG: DUF2497 domain-containing protein, partial [Pseudomonadota bacterium]
RAWATVTSNHDKARIQLMANPQGSKPSMEDILSSIRKIIDESGSGETVPTPTVIPAAPEPEQIVIDAEPAPMAKIPPLPELRAEPEVDNRFTPEDAEAFREVAQVLQSTASIMSANEPTPDEVAPTEEALESVVPDFVNSNEPPEPASAQSAPAMLNETIAQKVVPLVSETASQSIAQTLAALDSVLGERTGQDLKETTEELLKPMLAEWLDENLPSMVERLVRQEIERIARGEPRAA